MNNQQLPSQTKEQQQQRHLHRHFHNVPCMSILLPRRNRPHLHLNRKNTCQLSLIKTPTLYHHLVLPCIILRRTNRQKCEMTQSTKLFLLHISLLSRQDICANCWSSSKFYLKTTPPVRQQTVSLQCHVFQKFQKITRD